MWEVTLLGLEILSYTSDVQDGYGTNSLKSLSTSKLT